MKTILILGSKPDAVIPPNYDEIFASNASLEFFKKSLSNVNKTLLLSAGEVSEENIRALKKQGKGQLAKEKMNLIMQSNFDNLIVLNKNDSLTFTSESQVFLNKAEKVLDSHERRKVVYKVTSLLDPIMPINYAKKYGLISALGFLYNKTKFLINSYHSRDMDCDSQFRASTGVFALVYAISKYGSNAKYILSGVGITNRLSYSISGDKSRVKASGRVPHVEADLAILKRVLKKYDVCITDAELASVFEKSRKK